MRPAAEAREPVTVACAADEAYALPLAVMVRSALVSLCGRALRLYVLDGGLTHPTRSRLLRSWSDYDPEVHWIPADAAALNTLPLWGRMTAQSYQRLRIGELLPGAVSRLLWLDCDLVVVRDLGAMWDLPLGPHTVLAAQDLVIPCLGSRFGVAAHSALGLAAEAPYLNAGVMALDLDRWRSRGIEGRALQYLERYGDGVWFWDQEALNVALAGEWGQLDPRWNQIASVAGRRFFRPTHLDAREYEAVARDPWIAHFAGTLKPWLTGLDAGPAKLFFEHLDGTDWAGWRPPCTLRSALFRFYDAYARDLLYSLEGWMLQAQRRWTRRSAAPARRRASEVPTPAPASTPMSGKK